jgi:glycerate 2-kinase
VRIIVAPDSFKGCLAAGEVCDAVEAGLLSVWPEAEIEKIPMADGGEGTVAALVAATGGRYATERVIGPMGKPVEATFGVLGDAQTAVIEMAAASGLTLVPPHQRNPLLASTFGTGQLMEAALDRGCRRIVIGIGGSATNDGGAGMAQALGVRMYSQDGTEIKRVSGGKLADVAHINMRLADGRLAESQIRVACDVDNPLYGPHGAAHTYGPQKGATEEQIELLDAGLRSFAAVIKKDLGQDVADIPGAGAAGGLGAGLMAFCGAKLEPGVDIVLDAVRLRDRMCQADLCFTGEGRMDGQTAHGKAPSGVARIAAEFGVPVIALAGGVTDDAASLHAVGFHAMFDTVTAPLSVEEAMSPERTRRALAFIAGEVARVIALGKRAGS